MSLKSLMDYTFTSKYARYLPNEKRRETWKEANDRVRNMMHRQYQNASEELHKKIDWAYDMMYKKKVLGSQRALQFGGDPIFSHNGRIYNCTASYVDRLRFFQECMYLLLCGCGTGFSVQKHHIAKLPPLLSVAPEQNKKFVIEDSIEGWSDAVGVLICSYFDQQELFPEYTGYNVVFDYTNIRAAGSPVAGGVGKAPGPEPLKKALKNIKKILDAAITRNEFSSENLRRLKPIEAYDIIMHASDAVISGGVRRSATICVFSPDDGEMATAKIGNWFTENPQRGRSNNSALLLRDSTTKEHFNRLMELVRQFGEPGFVWSDSTELIVNPCVTIDTKILTIDGWKEIGSLLGKDIDIYQDSRVFGGINEDGEFWDIDMSQKNECVVNMASNVRKTGVNRDVYQLELSCGRTVKATDNHHFATPDGMCELKDLSTEDCLLIPIPPMANINKESKDFNIGYLYGLIFGDGCFTDNAARISLWGESDLTSIEKMVESIISPLEDSLKMCRGNTSPKFSTVSGEQYGSAEKHCLQSSLLATAFEKYGLKTNKEEISFIHNTSKGFKSGFISGLFYADGHSEYSESSKSLSLRITSIKKNILQDVQLLLQELGVFSRINIAREAGTAMLPDSNRDYKEYSTQNCYRLIIGGLENCFKAISVLKLNDKHTALVKEKYNNRKTSKTNVFTSKVESITYVGKEDVYCLSENNRRTMIVEGITSRRCVEIGMYPVDTETGLSGWQGCNLSTINCAKVRTEEDFYEACRAAAIIGTLQAGFTSFPYLGEVSERIFAKEALLGVSGTGWLEKPEICLNEKVQRNGAEIVKSVNKEIAALIGINPAARTTCVKPEGCLTKETMVQTSEGILRLDEIGDIYGEQWQDLNMSAVTDFNNQQVSKFYKNGLKPVKKILTSGGVELSATHSHKFRVIRNSQYIWVESKNLKIGDKMPYKVGGYSFGSKQYLENIVFEKSKHASNLKEFNPIEYIDEDFAWFLGLYVGDGSNHENKSSIRIHGDYRKQENLIKAQNIIKDKFGVDSYIFKYNKDENDNRCALYITSKQFYSFLAYNNLLKNRSKDISIPLAVRKSNKEVIRSFIDGYGCADGCVKSRTRSFCTTSKIMAEQLVQCLRAIGVDCKMRLMPPTQSSFGSSMRYWIQERVGRKSIRHQSKYDELDNLGLNNFSYDEIIDIQDGEDYTYDITINHEDHTYIANSYVSHNTASCVLGTASGIHPHHAKRYIRRVQANKMENVYKLFKKINPRACESSVWSANDTDDVISFCIEVPDGSKTKNQTTAISLLEIVKSTQENWVINGKNPDLCTRPWLTHNVSNTINVQNDEWDEVADFIYSNKEFFCGVSLLSATGDKDYPQAPFTTVYLPSEMLSYYGEGVMFVSGLIETALVLWEDNLWQACSDLLGMGNKIKGSSKIEWVKRCSKYAANYFDGDVKKLTYAMKDVYNYKLWTELQREYKDVDYILLTENEDNTKLEQELACAGGACEI